MKMVNILARFKKSVKPLEKYINIYVWSHIIINVLPTMVAKAGGPSVLNNSFIWSGWRGTSPAA